MQAKKRLRLMVCGLVVGVVLSNCGGCGDTPTQPIFNAAPSSEYVDGWRTATGWIKANGASSDGQIANFLINFEIPMRRVEWQETAEYGWEEVVKEPVPFEEVVTMKAVDIIFKLSPDWDAMSQFQLGAMARLKMRNLNVDLVESYPAEPIEED